jgi:CHASE1-domain containing sensor protein
MSPVVYALGVLVLGLTVAVLVLSQRLRRVEQRLRREEQATRDMARVRKREVERQERKRLLEEQRAARH